MNDIRDIEEITAVNNAAIESIERLEGSDVTRKSFWDTDPARRYRPSQQNTSVPLFGSSRSYDEPVPRKYYRGSMGGSVYDTSGYSNTPDSFFRKMLITIYKNPVVEESNEIEMEVEDRVVNVPETMSLSFSSVFSKDDILEETAHEEKSKPGTRNYRERKSPVISETTRNQVLGIVMTNVVRVLSTLVINWNRDNKVPFELL